MSLLTYRDYELKQDTNPIRLGLAWFYVHEDYDGPEDGRCGFRDTIEECVEAINQLDDVDMGPDEEGLNAELLRVELELHRGEARRVLIEETCRTMAATRYIEDSGMTIDQCWTWVELQEVYGFHSMIHDYIPILCRDGKATRRWFEWNTEFYETAPFIAKHGKWVNSRVTEKDLDQFASSIATKPEANPA